MRTLALQAPAMRWQLELRLVSGCSGHADQNRPSASTAGSCICLSNCMSLAAHRHLLHALCWLAWCSRQTSEVGARDPRRTRLMQGCCGRHRSTCGLLMYGTRDTAYITKGETHTALSQAKPLGGCGGLVGAWTAHLAAAITRRSFAKQSSSSGSEPPAVTPDR